MCHTHTHTAHNTPDFSGAQEAFTRAQQLIAAQDWPGAISALDQMRKLDPNYQQSQVDGMYYFAFRNYGYNLITQRGNLEGGIYQLTLAERFGTLDRDTNGLREGARYYLLGASFWDLDWQQAVFYFSQVYGGWPSLWDGTLTAADRFRLASMRYGDDLLAQERFCDAFTQYDNAQKVGALDEQAEKVCRTKVCYPATVTRSRVCHPTTDGGVVTPTDTQPASPTDTSVPSETPLHDDQSARLGAGAHILVASARHRHVDRLYYFHFDIVPPRRKKNPHAGGSPRTDRSHAKKTRAHRMVLHESFACHRVVPDECQPAL
jgi:tetratricopeptide (TPR) repeat protein